MQEKRGNYLYCLLFGPRGLAATLHARAVSTLVWNMPFPLRKQDLNLNSSPHCHQNYPAVVTWRLSSTNYIRGHPQRKMKRACKTQQRAAARVEESGEIKLESLRSKQLTQLGTWWSKKALGVCSNQGRCRYVKSLMKTHFGVWAQLVSVKYCFVKDTCKALIKNATRRMNACNRL